MASQNFEIVGYQVQLRLESGGFGGVTWRGMLVCEGVGG
jgi:hypothetical protein